MVRGLQIYRRRELKRMTITWNTGLAAERARHNLKLKNKKNKKRNKGSSSQAGGPAHKEPGSKPSSLTGPKL